MRRTFSRISGFLAACSIILGGSLKVTQAAPATPNIVVIIADDLGYGDLGCYGHPTIRTPQLDRMAAEGMRFTDFYVAANVCTPSRAGLLTGRLPIRSGMAGAGNKRVLYPNSLGGLPQEEITMAKALKPKGYATACIGKWHLGHLPKFLPTRHGFDYFFGLPYSNDMDAVTNIPPRATFQMNPRSEWWNVPLMRNESVLERAPDQTTLTKRYTEEALSFIKQNRQKPFFLYFAHTFPHVPLFASPQFHGKSPRGRYGDTVEELDWSVGQVLDTLRREKLEKNTLVVFTSDNGPWLVKDLAGGSAGLLRDGKGSCFDGGMRVPGIAWWPGKVRAGMITSELASTMDLFTTGLKLAGAELPKDRVIDGVDLSPILFQNGPSERKNMFFYRGDELYAVRQGDFKAHYTTWVGYSKDAAQQHNPPIVYNVAHDPAERFDVAKDHPEVIAAINAEREAHLKAMVPGTPQLTNLQTK